MLTPGARGYFNSAILQIIKYSNVEQKDKFLQYSNERERVSAVMLKLLLSVSSRGIT